MLNLRFFCIPHGCKYISLSHKPTPDIFRIIASNQRYFVFYHLTSGFVCEFLKHFWCDCVLYGVRRRARKKIYIGLKEKRSKMFSGHWENFYRQLICMKYFLIEKVFRSETSHCARMFLFSEITYFMAYKKNRRDFDWCMQLFWNNPRYFFMVEKEKDLRIFEISTLLFKDLIF